MPSSFSRLLQRQFAGPGGITELWRIALPMVISTALDTAMMFIDRCFLARLDPLHMAACMTGGITAFACTTFFIGLIGYATALVAHQYGAGQKAGCPRTITQGLILALVAYPVVLALWPLGVASFHWAGHSPRQIELETSYFSILLFGTLIILVRCALSSFFSGIGRTRVVMVGNLAGLAVNTVVAWVLIFGKCGLPPMGMAGAALAVLAGDATALLIQFVAYLRPKLRQEFKLDQAWRFDRPLMGRLLRYGFPSGLEFVVTFSAFAVMVSLFNGYGEAVAAAVTLAFNWDMVAFVPMIGLQIAVTSLVGQNLGRGDEAAAIRAAWSGLKLNLVYSGIMLLLFISIPDLLIRAFQPDVPPPNYDQIVATARIMIIMMCVYPLSDGMFIVFSGAIRGAGDTTWAMAASSLLHWGAVLNTWFLTCYLKLDPVSAWIGFVLVFPIFGLTFWWRFRSGKWRGHLILPAACTTRPRQSEPTPCSSSE
ncbi:MAG: MATE family efflux transporter [bacterium]